MGLTVWLTEAKYDRWVGLVIVVGSLVGLGYGIWQQSATAVVHQGDYGAFDSKQAYDQFYKAHPLLTAQPASNQPFTISSLITDRKLPVYTITLQTTSPQVDDPASISRFIASLKANQQAAKKWISSLGQNPNDPHIIWVPNPDQLTNTPLDYETTPPMPQRQTTNPAPTSAPTTTATPTETAHFPE